MLYILPLTFASFKGFTAPITLKTAYMLIFTYENGQALSDDKIDALHILNTHIQTHFNPLEEGPTTPHFVRIYPF